MINISHSILGYSNYNAYNIEFSNVFRYVEYADQTAILREGYWASYNVPFYESIANKSGWPAVVATMGPDASHDLYPRAKIFRRDQGKVKIYQ